MVKLFKTHKIIVDSIVYKVLVKKHTSLGPEHPRLVIVSYLPERETVKLIKVAVKTIREYTAIPYELWIVDNNSPKRNLRWLLKQKDINLVLNRTEPEPPDGKYKGSYANGVALEIAKQLVDTETKYFMTLHQDIAVCKKNWLEFLLSKFTNNIKAVGVRMDYKKVESGVLHVLGYIVDFQIILKNNLSFMPQLLNYDTGDKVVVYLKNNGFSVHNTLNTFNDKELDSKIDAKFPFKNKRVDIAVDDCFRPFFLHLGRGVLKSQTNDVNDTGHVSANEWYNAIRKHFLK